MIIENNEGFQLEKYFFPKTEWTRAQVEKVEDMLILDNNEWEKAYDQGYQDEKDDAGNDDDK